MGKPFLGLAQLSKILLFYVLLWHLMTPYNILCHLMTLFLWVRSPCKNLEPYYNPVWYFSYVKWKERRVIPIQVALLVVCTSLGPIRKYQCTAQLNRKVLQQGYLVPQQCIQPFISNYKYMPKPNRILKLDLTHSW